ncbi:hypothetical protein HDU96_006485, partial [Phlyctochytrium bullatum]
MPPTLPWLLDALRTRELTTSQPHHHNTTASPLHPVVTAAEPWHWALPARLAHRRFASLDVAENRTVKRARAGPCNQIAVEAEGERMMLAGFTDSSIRMYDLAAAKRIKRTMKTVVKPTATIE